MGRTLPYAGYRFRTTLRSELSHYISVIVLVGALGGLSMGAVAAARSTESSFSDLVASSHVPNLFVLDGVINPAIGLDSAYNPALLRKLSHLPHVERVADTLQLNIGPLTPKGRPLPASLSVPGDASVNGLYFTKDPVAITEGRMADPHKAGELVLDAATAKAFGYHLGEEIPVGWQTNAQTSSGNLAPNSTIPTDERARVRLVGIAGAQATNLFEDQDEAQGTAIELFTPALTNKLLACCSSSMLTALTLQDGNRYLSAVEEEIKGVLPKGLPFVYVQVKDRVAIANDTLRPEAIALAVFGGIAGIAALLIAGQVVSRRIRLRAADLDIIRALGASPSMTFGDDLIGTLGAVAVGSVLAGMVALCLSPLAPLGPVRPFLRVEVHADWAVIGLGVAGLLLSLGAIAALASWRALPGRARVRDHQRPSSSRVTTAAARAGLPPPAITGVRFALEPGVGRSAVPVRSAILGAILAVTVVVATVTFGSSLNTLVSHPALYGWNWTYDMDGGGGLGDVPGQRASELLNADPLVESWSGVSYSTLQLDGVNVPVMGATPRAPVAPPMLSGHSLQARDQVVLGAGTLHQLHKRVGDTVEERAPNGAPVRLTIVGTATLPPIGVTGSSHLEMGTGALLSYQLIPPAARNLFEVTPGPNAILIRTRGGASEAALRSIQAIGRTLGIAINGGAVLPVQRPAQIINYGSLGTTPLFLGAALAAGAVSALGITLVTSVRRRRRDLAILKTLGFTGRQLATAVSVQAGVAAVIGCAVGIPAGIALGRALWDLFAGEISAVPYPTVPVGTIVAIGILAIVLAALVATIPGRIAARTATSQLLRAE